MTYQFDQQLAIDWAIRIGSAILILIVAHFVAKAVKWGIAKGIDRIPFLSRRDGATGTSAKPVVDVGERIGEVGYWLVWLLGLILALQRLQLDAIVTPLNEMVSGFLAYLPSVVGAAIIFFVGFVLATILRRIVQAAVEAAELDRRLIGLRFTG